MAQVLSAASHHLEAHKLLLSAHDLAESSALGADRVGLALADSQLALGDFDKALGALKTLTDSTSLELGERHEALVLKAHAQAGLGNYAAALDTLAEATELRGNDRELSCRGQQLAALVHALKGDWKNSGKAAALSAADAQATGMIQQEISSAHYEGEALIFQEEWARAYAALRKSLALATDAGAERWVNRNNMLLAFLEARGGSALARQALGRSLAEAERTRVTQDVAKGRLLIARLLASEGAAVAARREVELAKEIAGSIGHTLLVRECETALAESPHTE
jgi:tetratricopeptide (TPR) repeat protein